MRGRFFSLIFLMLAVSVLHTYTQSRVFWFVFCLLLATVFSSFLFVVILSKTVKYTVHSNASSFIRGSEAMLQMQIVNASALPYCRATVHPSQQHRAHLAKEPNASETIQTCMLPMRDTYVLRFAANTTHCGVYQVDMKRIFIAEPFGLFHVRIKKAKSSPTLYIVPQQLSYPDLLPPEQTELRATQSREELADISDFQENDSTRNIHWKHTMRRQKLVATHYEETIRGKTALVIDLRITQNLEMQACLQRGDWAGDFAFTAMKQAQDENRALHVWILQSNGTEEHFIVSDTNAILNATFRFASLQPQVIKKKDSSLHVLPAALVDNSKGLTLCYIAHQLTAASSDALHVLQTSGANIRIAAFCADANVSSENIQHEFMGKETGYA